MVERLGRRWLVAGFAIVAVLTSIAAVWWLTRSPDPGPLYRPAHTKIAVPLEADRPMTFGELILTNPTDEAATLVSASLVDPAAGLSILGVSALPRTDPFMTNVSTGWGWPPDGVPLEPQRPVEGTIVPPAPDGSGNGQDVQILFGLAAADAGAHAAHGIELVYTVGTARFKAVFDMSLVLCAPSSAWTGDACEATLP